MVQSSVLQALFESMSVLLRNVIDKRTLLENFDYLLLCIDEIVDNGYAARLLLRFIFVVGLLLLYSHANATASMLSNM